MGRTLHHRFPRWLRWAAIGTLLCRDAVAMDTITIGVMPVSNTPPAAVTDLLASANPVVQGQISLTWTAPQGNVGGVPVNNQSVAAYSIHYATFSVASLAGDTTSWWNATVSSNALFQPPAYTPKSPGQLE